jgi:two-component system phosphate regulon sensor histidine kinase PhoR
MFDSLFILKMLKEAEIGFWIQELDKWEVLWVNDKLGEILNADSSGIIGHDIRSAFNKEGQRFLTSFKDYNPKLIEIKGKNPDTDTDIQLSVGTVEDKYLYGVVRDITMEKRAFNALRASEERLRALIQATRAGMTVTNPEGLIVYSNQAFADLVGFNSPTELIGYDITDFIMTYEFLLSLDQFVLMKIYQMDGKNKDVLISVDPVSSQTQKSTAVGVIADVSWLPSSRLKQEKTLNEFLQITVHEMGTPITLLKGFIELLPKKYSEKDGYDQKIIEALLRNARKLERQITAIKDVENVDKGIFSIEKRLICFDELQTALEYDIDLMKERSRIRLNFQNYWNADTLFSLDLDRLTQAIYNLIENACHHSPKTTEIEAKIFMKKKSLNITIQDQGVGIPEDMMNKVFKPFFSKSTTYHKKGMGLGLYIAKTIVERHGGRISLNSKVNKGTKFRIEIPI